MAFVWRKSSYSGGAGGNGNTGDCVEVAFGPSGSLVRDSKAGNDGRILTASHGAFGALVTALKRH